METRRNVDCIINPKFVGVLGAASGGSSAFFAHFSFTCLFLLAVVRTVLVVVTLCAVAAATSSIYTIVHYETLSVCACVRECVGELQLKHIQNTCRHKTCSRIKRERAS